MNNENNQNQNVSVSNSGEITSPNIQPVTPPVENTTTPVVPNMNSTPTATPVSPVVGTNATTPAASPASPVAGTNATTSVANSNVVGNGESDHGAVVNENLKKVEIDYTPPSKFKVFCLVLFFILLIAFVFFLPDISSYIRMARSGELNKAEEIIKTGILDCSLSTQTTNLDKKYEVSFSFTDSKLESTQFIITTRGDVSLDANVLDKLNDDCKNLSQNVKQLKGVKITCDYSSDTLVEKQSFQLADLDSEELDAAFVEAGVNTPSYSYGQNIDKIEQQMNASKYTCKRRKTS